MCENSPWIFYGINNLILYCVNKTRQRWSRSCTRTLRLRPRQAWCDTPIYCLQYFSFKRFVGRSVSYLILLECACIAGSYIGYRKINHDQEFRYKLYSSEYSTLNVIVEGYYKLGEQMNSECSIRQLDQDHWKSQGKAL